MQLWLEWYRCVRGLRGACSRSRTFMWMVLALVGMSIREELRGVTSFVRAANLLEAAYLRLLHLFHTPALGIDKLTELWIGLGLRLFSPLRVGSLIACVADGIKVAKEGRKMPAVKKLHQESDNNSKPSFIFGHHFQALGMLVRGPLGRVSVVPLVSRIQEGLVFNNRDRRTLLDKFVALFLPLAGTIAQPILLIADAYFASRKVIRPLLAKGHHLLTRVRSNAVAYHQAERPSRRRRGRPRLYGEKVRLRDLWSHKRKFSRAPSPVYGEKGVEILYRSLDLLWRPVGRLVRFVLVIHPSRGRMILMTTHIALAPLTILELYGYRYKIELGFKQALHTLGAYAYHFWMMDMSRISRRRSGNQYLHKKTEDYRRLVRRKMDAYHRYVQLACVAQGLLQHLSLNFRKSVWDHFRSWMRTMKPEAPPSEAVVSQALRDHLPEFLLAKRGGHDLEKFISENANLEETLAVRRAG